MIEEQVSHEDYKEKIEKYNKRLELLESKIEQLELLQEDRQSISDGLIKIKELLSSKDIMEEFDQEVFNV